MAHMPQKISYAGHAEPGSNQNIHPAYREPPPPYYQHQQHHGVSSPLEPHHPAPVYQLPPGTTLVYVNERGTPIYGTPERDNATDCCILASWAMLCCWCFGG